MQALGAILGHTTVQMTMRYVHPAEEQKRVAVGKLEQYRLTGILEAIEKSRGSLQFPQRCTEQEENDGSQLIEIYGRGAEI